MHRHHPKSQPLEGEFPQQLYNSNDRHFSARVIQPNINLGGTHLNNATKLSIGVGLVTVIFAISNTLPLLLCHQSNMPFFHQAHHDTLPFSIFNDITHNSNMMLVTINNVSEGSSRKVVIGEQGKSLSVLSASIQNMFTDHRGCHQALSAIETALKDCQPLNLLLGTAMVIQR